MLLYRSIFRRHFSLSLALSLMLSLSSLTPVMTHFAFAAGKVDPDADYDRMDGTGKSGETVNVIEWEGNLEIHVTPPGTLKGLALKLDKRNKGKPVMVIGYRFANNPRQQLIRRAILGITLNDGFKAYKDPTESEFDKIIISNNGLSGQVALYKLDPTPTQLYPDGYPDGSAVAKTNGGGGNNIAGGGNRGNGGNGYGGDSNRAPASYHGGGNSGGSGGGGYTGDSGYSGNGGSGYSGSNNYSNGNSYRGGNGNSDGNDVGDLGAGGGYGTPSQEDAPPARHRHRGGGGGGGNNSGRSGGNSAAQVDDSGTIQPFGMGRSQGN